MFRTVYIVKKNSVKRKKIKADLEAFSFNKEASVITMKKNLRILSILHIYSALF